MNLEEKNLKAIEGALNTLNAKDEDLLLRVQTLEKNIVLLQAELANQKQLVAHVLGRGMGSTVNE